MRSSKAIFSSLAGFALVGALAGTAQADPPAADAECAMGYSLVAIDKAGDQERARQADGNKDQWVCEKTTTGKHTYTDNKKKKQQP